MKKSSSKNLSLSLAAFLSLGGLVGLGMTLTKGAVPALALSGTGSEDDPYLISDASQLESFRAAVNGGEYSACAKLVSDITLSGNWTPIGDSQAHGYVGTFDGNEHSITGLSINTTENNQGLFGWVGDATIKDLTVDGSISSTAMYLGAIAGHVYGSATFRNCVNNATVTATTSLGRYIGGVVGFASVGTHSLSLLNCVNNGEITGYFCVGGIVGSAGSSSSSVDNYSRIIGCVNNGVISATSNDNVTSVAGGIAGGIGGSLFTISKCFNAASVTTKRFLVGGIVGSAEQLQNSVFSDCYNAGAISNSNYQPANAYDDQNSTGGIAGKAGTVTIDRCYNYGTLTSKYDKGAILGFSYNWNATVTNCFFLSGTGGLASYSKQGDHGTFERKAYVSSSSLTAEQMKSAMNFYQWTFGQKPWTLRSGKDTRPILGIHKMTLDRMGGTGGGLDVFYNECHKGFYNNVSCEAENEITSVATPTKAGHDFGGYYTSSDGGTTLDDQIIGPDGNFAVNESFLLESGTLYAKWNAITRAANIAGGTGIKSVYVSDKTDGTDLKASGTAFLQGTTVYGYVELDKGYKHKDGWELVSGTNDTEGAKYRVTDGDTIVDSVIELGTFNADLITYSIAYELDGGSVATANPTSYTIENDAITLTNPTKEHCEFVGWTGTDLATPSMNVTIPSGSIGDREYTAHWIPMIAVLETSGTQYVYDGNDHSITGISFKNALTNEEIDCDVKFSADGGSTYTLNDAPSFSEIGDHTIYYRASKDGYVTLDGTITLTISKAPLDFTAPIAVDGLIYDGNDHALITAGSANAGDVLYAANTSGALPEEASFSSAIPTGNAATTYYVFYKATGDAHYAEIPASLENKVTVTIQKLESTMTAPTPKLGLVYTGEAQDLVTAGSTNAGEMQYAANTTGELPDAGDFSAVIPTGTAPATYHVFYRTTGDATHDAIPASSDNKVTVTITKLQSTLEAPKAKLGLIYDGTAQDLVTAGSTNSGEMLYAANTSGELPNDASFSSMVPTGTAAATYYVFYKTTGDLTHDAIAASLENKVTVVIAAAETTCEAPKAKVGLLYTGESQELITAGSTEAGEMLYAVNTTDELPAEGDFSAAIPTGKSVATYYVFYKTTGDANHAPVAASLDNKVTVKIARADRSEAEKANKEASDYLDTLKNDSKFADIVSTLEGARNKLIAEAITADDVTEAEVAASVAVLRDAIEAAKVSVVEALIDAIGNLSYDGGKNDSLKDINTAKAAYDALTDAQKAKVASAKVTTLNHDIEVYSHVDPVGKMIAALPTPASEQSYYDAVDAAKAAYDALTAEEKALLDASFGYKKILEDNVAAKEVIMTISEIGEVSYDEISEEKINAARKAYDSLSDEVKAKIDPKILGVLTNAEKEYSSLANYNKIAAITLTFVSGAAFLCGFLWLLLVPLRKKDDDKDDDDGNGPKKAKAA